MPYHANAGSFTSDRVRSMWRDHVHRNLVREAISAAALRTYRARHPNLREDAFEEPLTDEAIYWLAFILCDGYWWKGGSHRGRVIVKLGGKDADHVQKLADFLGWQGKPFLRMDPLGHRIAGVVVSSNRLYASIRRLAGCKSEVRPEEISVSMRLVSPGAESHFYRGFFDADGSIFSPTRERDRQRPVVCLTSTEPIVRSFAGFIERTAGIAAHSRVRLKAGRICTYGLKFQAASDVSKVLLAIAGEPRLARKAVRADEALRAIKDLADKSQGRS